MLKRTIALLGFCIASSANTHAELGEAKSATATCPKTGVYLQVLGSGGPELNDKRASSAYVVWADGVAQVLVDLGNGAANNMGLAGVDISQVPIVLLTHLHSDHSADFAPLIKALFFTDRQTDLQVYGPTASKFFPDTETFVQRFVGEQGVYPYLQGFVNGNARYQIKAHNLTPSPQVQTLDTGEVKITAIDAEHGPVPSLAYRVEIDGKSLTFSGDNGGHSDNLIRLAQGSDLLVAHNAIPEGAKGVVVRLHMLPSRIGEISRDAQVKQVLLSHFMSRTVDQQAQTLAAINAFYKGPVEFASDMQCVEL
ncbi:Lactamase_B domain-containing protein [Pseudomonas marincola]|uniref:Metallo-beta-lactamase domain-containing protein n=1 Tax=Pseudomonas marincola TaxID=437900 RepID=A0A653E987_9PSED|nr:MBL fold metallo-hydrolase [Pseudomonas marincola]CAE6924492.1 Lactamase_B domain-containing protein [Pseudomonas marincola]